MSILSFRFWRFTTTRLCSIAYFWTIRFKIWPSLKKALKKVDKYFLIFPKVATFRHVWSHWVADTPPHKPTSPYCKIVWRQIFDSDNFHHPTPPLAPAPVPLEKVLQYRRRRRRCLGQLVQRFVMNNFEKSYFGLLAIGGTSFYYF